MEKFRTYRHLKCLQISFFLSLFSCIQTVDAQSMPPSGTTENKTSLECHQTLNPKLWDGEKLKPEVRQALLKFADSFAQFSKVPKNVIQDVVMVGGNTNYNYTSRSDIDVHLFLDRNKLGSDRAMVDDYVQVKKDYWVLTHNIKVYGYNIEPYVEDLTTLYAKDKGIYSVQNNEWLQKPVLAHCTTGDQLLVQRVNKVKKEIDDLLARQPSVREVQNFEAELKRARQVMIKNGGGEFDMENLVFKELRAQQYIDKIEGYMREMSDKELSLSEK